MAIDFMVSFTDGALYEAYKNKPMELLVNDFITNATDWINNREVCLSVEVTQDDVQYSGYILKNEHSGIQLKKKHEEDAGFDICSAEDLFIEPLTAAVVSTGLYIQLPKGYVGIVKSRSGFSIEHNVEVGAGVIDSNYRGELRVKLYCHSKFHGCKIRRGDRIAQLLVIPVSLAPFKEVEALDSSDRGVKGCGSSGMRPFESVGAEVINENVLR